MKTSKKIISLALCASMILGLTACDQSSGLGEVTTIEIMFALPSEALNKILDTFGPLGLGHIRLKIFGHICVKVLLRSLRFNDFGSYCL